jgi:hypothetical protein
MHSIAANLAGWSSAMERAAVSPTKSWIGVAIAASEGIANRAGGSGHGGPEHPHAHGGDQKPATM